MHSDWLLFEDDSLMIVCLRDWEVKLIEADEDAVDNDEKGRALSFFCIRGGFLWTWLFAVNRR